MAGDEGRGDEIERARTQEQGLTSAAKREAAEKRRQLKIFSGKAWQAITANDARAFAEQLRLANVRENSPEWGRAWEFFRSHCG